MDDFNYIKYNNGTEELYNHENDRMEYTNVVDNPSYKTKKEELSKWYIKSKK